MGKECADMEGENKDRNEELHKKESEQEPLTMTTHTNIDIGAFRISDSNKEKNIDQTNSDDCPHEQEKKELEVKKIEGQKIKGKEREDDRIEKKEREEKETKQIKKSDKNEEKGNNGENSRKLEVNEVLPIVEEMKECADMEGENKDRNEELHKKESEQ